MDEVRAGRSVERVPEVAVVVAHPGDETLWAGGAILMRPTWRWTVLAMTHGSDDERRSRYVRAIAALGATGVAADLDDDPEQRPLPADAVEAAIAGALPARSFDIVITHSPFGEYQRQIRHEETARAVLSLWRAGRVAAKEMWLFAYRDIPGQRLPRALGAAHIRSRLPLEIWRRKRDLIRDVYGLGAESFESRSTPRIEAFWCFRTADEALEWSAGSGREEERKPSWIPRPVWEDDKARSRRHREPSR